MRSVPSASLLTQYLLTPHQSPRRVVTGKQGTQKSRLEKFLLVLVIMLGVALCYSLLSSWREVYAEEVETVSSIRPLQLKKVEQRAAQAVEADSIAEHVNTREDREGNPDGVAEAASALTEVPRANEERIALIEAHRNRVMEEDPELVRLKRQLDSFAYRKAHKSGDVANLDKDRSPDSDSWTNSVAICAIMKGENTTDVREWLMYHRWLGVEKVYLMENVAKPTEELLIQIGDFIAEGFVKYSNREQRVYQLLHYRDCMEQYNDKHNWLTFIDLDEYIVLKDEQHESLPEFLDEFKHYPGLVMHWTIMGPSGQKNRPAAGGMLRAYTKCRGTPSPLVKSMVNTYYVTNIAGNPHTFEYRDNLQAVDENQVQWPWRWEPECEKDVTDNSPYEEQVLCRKIPERQNKQGWASFDRITVNHYLTKSEEDFRGKVERGSGGGTSRTWKEFNELEEKATDPCPWASNVADSCCSEDSYVWTLH